MKQKTSYPQISKGLARFLKMKKRTHFKQKNVNFDSISAKRYLQLFIVSQKMV